MQSRPCSVLIPHHRRLAAARQGGSRWCALAALALLVGCDAQRIEELEEGLATEQDVRALWRAERVWPEADGARTLEYNRQPAGHRNYMITIGADGKMAALRQVLAPHHFAKVQPGMAQEQVRVPAGQARAANHLSSKRRKPSGSGTGSIRHARDGVHCGVRP